MHGQDPPPPLALFYLFVPTVLQLVQLVALLMQVKQTILQGSVQRIKFLIPKDSLLFGSSKHALI